MGRRRRKIVKVPRKQLPKIFLCPRCGVRSVQVTMDETSNRAVVECGSCKLTGEIIMKPAWAPVDAYALWADKYYKSELD